MALRLLWSSMGTHRFDIDSVRRQLPGRQIFFFESITSTMHEAATLAAAGCPSGTAVVAEEQTAGQGRHGHSWHSEPGAGLVGNVNHPAFPPEIAAEATSLRLASGRPHSREDQLICLLPTIDSFCRMLLEGGRHPILDQFARHSSYVHGKRVRVEQPGGIVTGTTAGLDPAGFLKLRADDGSESLILAGGVRPV